MRYVVAAWYILFQNGHQQTNTQWKAGRVEYKCSISEHLYVGSMHDRGVSPFREYYALEVRNNRYTLDGALANSSSWWREHYCRDVVIALWKPQKKEKVCFNQKECIEMFTGIFVNRLFRREVPYRKIFAFFQINITSDQFLKNPNICLKLLKISESIVVFNFIYILDS